MAEKDTNHREKLFSDIPGDVEKVRMILTSWGVEEASIRRMMRERRMKREFRASSIFEQKDTPNNAGQGRLR